MQQLRDVGTDVLTLGQYLRPTPKHHEVMRFVHPDQFAAWAEAGTAMGFRYVASGPLVRSSYKAAEAFLRGALRAAAVTQDTHAAPAPRHRALPIVS